MNTKRNQRGILFIRKMPTGVKDAFKAWCIRRGISMTDKVVEMMEDCVQNDEMAARAVARERKRR